MVDVADIESVVSAWTGGAWGVASSQGWLCFVGSCQRERGIGGLQGAGGRVSVGVSRCHAVANCLALGCPLQASLWSAWARTRRTSSCSWWVLAVVIIQPHNDTIAVRSRKWRRPIIRCACNRPCCEYRKLKQCIAHLSHWSHTLLPSCHLSLQSNTLSGHLIGQDDAVQAVASALVRARCGLRDPNRPVASLLFVGPTGERLAGGCWMEPALGTQRRSCGQVPRGP